MSRTEFDAMPDELVEALRPYATRHEHPARTTVFQQGEPAHALFILERGQVELVTETAYERLVVGFVHAGNFLDELAVVLERPYRYSGVTLSDSAVLSVRLDTARALEQLFPEIAFRWLRLVAGTLERAYGRLDELAGRSALEQVSYLLDHESAGRRPRTVELTQNEIAASLALSRQTVSRALQYLVQKDVIRQERRRIYILDLDELRRRLPRL
jgi:CRP-like cAMP-binding protein